MLALCSSYQCYILQSEANHILRFPSLQALRDLADPAEGVYNATALLETRLSYVCNMLDKYQKLPNSRPMQAGGPSASLAVTAPEEVSGSTLLSSVVTAIKNVTTGEEHEVIEEKRQVCIFNYSYLTAIWQSCCSVLSKLAMFLALLTCKQVVYLPESAGGCMSFLQC